MDVIVERCAALDVHKKTVMAAVRTPGPKGRRQEVKEFSTFTADLEQLRDWLAGEGVTQVAMEATGVYWRPVWHVLEAMAGVELLLVNPRHVDETARMLRAQRDSAKELAEAAGVEFSTDDFVFPRSPGSSEPLPPNRIGQAWRRLCREVGVDARLHDLRHLQASLLLDAGEAITTVSTLKIYSHLMRGADQRAAEIVGKALSRPPADEPEES